MIEQCFDLYLKHQRALIKESDLEILTPQFYTDIALAGFPGAYISSFATIAPDRRTFYISKGLTSLVDALSKPCFEEPCPHLVRKSLVERFCWRLLWLLRRGRGHPLDSFVEAHLPSDLARAYRGSITAILMSQYLCFGAVEILDGLRMASTLGLAWLGIDSALDHLITMK